MKGKQGRPCSYRFPPTFSVLPVAVAEDSELTNVTVDWLSCHGGENCSQECE